VAGLFIKLNKMFNKNQIQKVEIDQEKKKLYVYYVQDNSHLMSNPPPPPSYYREVFSFDNLEFIEKEYAKVERGFEKVTWS
jgi:hypothetical protein